jgi:hypothetical protein
MIRQRDASGPGKDPDAEVPIPEVWRPTLRDVVRQLARRDHSLQRMPSVHVSRAAAEQIASYVADYEKLW